MSLRTIHSQMYNFTPVVTRSWTIRVAPWDRRILGMTGTVKAHVKFTSDGIWVDRVAVIPNN